MRSDCPVRFMVVKHALQLDERCKLCTEEFGVSLRMSKDRELTPSRSLMTLAYGVSLDVDVVHRNFRE